MRLHRADPLLNDAIESLDQFLREAKRQFPKTTPEEQRSRAWNLLQESPNSFQFVIQEIARCTNDRVYYLQNYHVIQPEQGILTCLSPLYDHQWMVENTLARLMAEEGQARIITLKPRQSGLTEYCTGVSCWRTFFLPHAYTIAVAQAPDVAAHIQRKIILAYNSLPWWMQSEQLYRTKGEFLEWGRKDATHSTEPGLGSVLVTTHAMRSSGIAIGRTCRTLHMCLSRNNQIIDKNGYHKSIADARIGDLVRTPKGTAHITAVSSRPASSIYTGAENGYRVTSWCGSGFPIEGTGNHRVMVAETKPLHVIERRRVKRGEGVRSHVVIWQGMKELSALTLKDKLVYPVRAISNGGAPHLVGRELVSGDNRPQRGGVVSRWMPPVFGREMGFAFGLYLAEGCVSEGRRCVTITLDKDEIDYAKRFGRAIGMNYGKPNPNKGTRTVHYNFYSAALTDWFRSNLGAKDDKHIPEWAWHCGRDFLLGMFEGMILGDGYINPDFRVICFSSTRAHLAVELRDLACALGFGWGSIYRSKGGLRYGRNCQPRYDVVFCNISDNLIRAEFNWKSATCTSLKGRNATASHWAYSTDSRQVYVGIRSISRVPLDDVYDIEIDSPEHEFLLPCAWTHNSEVSRWPDGECYTGDIEPSMNAPDTIAFSESTAWGNEGFFYNLWQESTSGDSDWTAVFLAAYRAKKYSLPIKPSQQPFELTPTEAAFTERVRKEEKWEIQPEFWNWRRKRIKASISRTGFPYAHYESYPITPEEAFQSSGMGAFPRHKLDEQQQKNVKKPEWVGEIVYQGKGAIPKLLLNHMLDKEGNYIDVALEKRELTNRLYVWEQPNPSASYYLGCDVGDGILGSDFTVVEIFRAGYGMEPDTQVAEWVGYEPPIAFAKILYSLGWWYNQSEIAVEYAKEGTATANELAMGLEYPKLYVPRHPDKTGNQLTRYIHWQTTGKTKPYLMTRMNESLLEDSIVIRSQYLLDELRRCVKDASSFAGLGGHDDAAVAACIAHYCMRETMPELRRASRQQTESTFSTPSASRQPAIGTRIFCILDEFYRVRGQTRDLNKATEFITKNPNWTIRPVVASKANTHYSVIHHGTGLENELFRGGMSDRDISPGLVTEYAAATGRLTQHGELARTDGSASSVSNGGGGMWDSNLGDLGGDLGDWDGGGGDF